MPGVREANGQTYDEGVTLAAGLRFLETGADDVNLEHPPLAKAIVAWPVRTLASPHLDVGAWAARRESAFGLGRDLFYNSGVPYDRLLWLGWAPVIVLSVALFGVIGLFAWRLWGPPAALLAIALTAFDPTLIAHGSLIGLDMPLTVWVTAGFFCLHESLRTRRPAWLWLTGVFAGCALATKHSGAMFVGAMCAALIAHAMQTTTAWPWWSARRESGGHVQALLFACGNAALVVAVAALIALAAVGRAGYQPYLIGLQAQLAHQAAVIPRFCSARSRRTGGRAIFRSRLP